MGFLSCRTTTLFVIVLFILQSCHRSDEHYLQEVESVIFEYPDSALILLDSISLVNLPDEEAIHNYNLLRIQTKDKLYQDITQDSAILEAATYYITKNNIEKAAQANYYCGRFYDASGEKDKAMSAYLEASRYAQSLDDSEGLKGVILANIGYLLFDESEYRESLTYQKRAFNHFRQGNKMDNQISVLSDIGNCYMLLGQKDSANFYYNESLTLANQSNSPNVKLKALQNLALVYQLQDDNVKAIRLYNQALPLADSIMTAKIYLSLTRIYSYLHKPDSVEYYFGKAKEIGNEINAPYFIANLYSISSEINEESGNYRQALSDYKEYTKIYENLSLDNEKKTVLNIQKKYEYERIKNQNNELNIRNLELLITLLIVTFILIGLFIFYKYRMRKNKKSLEEAEDRILKLNELASSYDEKETTFRSILLHQFNIMKKSATIQITLREYEIKKGEKLLRKFNDIVYQKEELDWNILYGVMNELHYGFLDKLKNLVPDLDESEYRICCLLYSDFSNEEIGLIMKLSSSTVTHKRSSIRKKMGIEGYGNISEKLKSLSIES